MAYMPLLKFVLDKKNFADRMILITVSMDAPWDIMTQLEKWARVLDDYINLLDITVEEMGEFKETGEFIICMRLSTHSSLSFVHIFQFVSQWFVNFGSILNQTFFYGTP